MLSEPPPRPPGTHSSIHESPLPSPSRYAPPGQPALAGRIIDMLQADGFKARGEPERGYDHGVFIPLKLMYPEADIPVVQASRLSRAWYVRQRCCRASNAAGFAGLAVWATPPPASRRCCGRPSRLYCTLCLQFVLQKGRYFFGQGTPVVTRCERARVDA